jgi:hypothetical protein
LRENKINQVKKKIKLPNQQQKGKPKIGEKMDLSRQIGECKIPVMTQWRQPFHNEKKKENQEKK